MSLAASLVAAMVLSSGAVPGNTLHANVRTDQTTASIFAPALDVAPDARKSSSPTLKVLYGSYFALQGLDVYSTVAARGAGAQELNPMMSGDLGQAIAVKAVAGVTTYYAVNQIAKHNRKAAIVMMAILNGVTAAVVANNMKNAK
jgi:hypothetical protein